MTQKLSDAQWALWLRMPRLSADEALALSYGLDPEAPGPVPGDYTLRRKLFMRSFAQLPSPKEFAKWAQQQDFNIPLPLAKLDLQEWPQPDPASDDLIDATLTPLVMPGAVHEVRGELLRQGHRVVAVDGAAYLQIADGSWKGRSAPLDRATLVGLCVSGSRLGEWLPGSGASGSGATASAGNLSFTQAPVFSESPHPPTDKTAETQRQRDDAEGRRHLLQLIEAEEERGGKRGALQRLANDLKVDRGNLGNKIRKAREERAAQERSGSVTSHLISMGKRR